MCIRAQSKVPSGPISAKILTMFSINPSCETDTHLQQQYWPEVVKEPKFITH